MLMVKASLGQCQYNGKAASEGRSEPVLRGASIERHPELKDYNVGE